MILREFITSSGPPNNSGCHLAVVGGKHSGSISIAEAKATLKDAAVRILLATCAVLVAFSELSRVQRLEVYVAVNLEYYLD